MVFPRDLIVSVSGVRGKVAESLTPEIVARFTAAYGSYLRSERGKRPQVIVGRDSRTSGPMFVRAVVSALQSVGCDVRDPGARKRLEHAAAIDPEPPGGVLDPKPENEFLSTAVFDNLIVYDETLTRSLEADFEAEFLAVIGMLR